MPVLDRSELEASPLADLHAIANELGVDGFRLLPREELIDAILGEESQERVREPRRPARQSADAERERPTTARRRRSTERSERQPSTRSRARASASERSGSADRRPAREQVEGVVELRDNGSAFLRVDPPGPSDDDIYISPAQVKRCELSSGDRVSGPVRRPRRSERHPSLARIETINGETAETGAREARSSSARASGSTGARASGSSSARGSRERERAGREGGRREGGRREASGAEQDASSAFPSEPLRFGSDDPTVQAVEGLAPIGYGSRAVIVGASRAGKTELLRRMLEALAGRDGLDVSLVLVGVRPEEIAEWEAGPLKPAAALSFASSTDDQDRAVEEALQKASRAATSGKNAIVLIDTLDGLHPDTARKALASAQKALARGRSRRGRLGSLTVIGTAERPFGGETTVIALDVALASSGRFPAIDVPASGTLRPELLVGEEGAREIMRAHASQTRSARGWRRIFGR